MIFSLFSGSLGGGLDCTFQQSFEFTFFSRTKNSVENFVSSRGGEIGGSGRFPTTIGSKSLLSHSVTYSALIPDELFCIRGAPTLSIQSDFPPKFIRNVKILIWKFSQIIHEEVSFQATSIS